jgi:adhesin transport system membrane fusion protein
MRPLIYSSLIGLAALGSWASLTTLPTVIRAEARVVLASRTQPLAHLEGGVVEEVLVREGDRVAEGQPLLRLAPAQAAAQAGEHAAQASALRARLARLAAEIDGADPVFAPGLDPRVAAAEHATLLERRREITARLDAIDRDVEAQHAAAAAARSEHAALTDQLQPALRQAQSLHSLVSSGAGSRGDADRAEAAVAEIRARMAPLPGRGAAAEATARAAHAKAEEARAAHASAVRQDQAEAAARLAALEETMQGSADRLQRTELASPVAGIVQSVAVARGRVARPGETLVEVVPTMGGTILESRVRAADMADVSPGLPAQICLSAFDFT